MYIRVQGFHPPIHHLGKAGQVGNFPNRQAGRRDRALAVPPVDTSSTPACREGLGANSMQGRSCRKRKAGRGLASARRLSL